MSMEIKIVGELMIPLEKYPYVSHWTTIRQAMETMEQAVFEVGGRKSLARVALVFDEQYKLLGMVRRRDILRAMEPDFLAGQLAHTFKETPVKPGVPMAFPEKLEAFVNKQLERPVSMIMTRIEAAVDYDDNIIEVAARMVAAARSLLAVLRGGEVVGVIRTVELIHHLALSGA